MTMIANLDEVVYDLEVDGEQVRRQLARRVWETRGWATVACAFQERGEDGAWKPTKIALLRFRRVRDAWKRHASLIVDAETAKELAAFMTTASGTEN